MERRVYTHPKAPDLNISIVRGDITKEKVDVIVNAANAQLRGGGGVDGAIHRAGGPEIMEECRAIRTKHGPLAGGQAVATTAGNLSAMHVVHTAGPIYRDGEHGEVEHLSECYDNSLKLAAELRANSVAFPAISCGIYGYPFEDAIELAFQRMHAFLNSDETPKSLAIRLILFNPGEFERATSVARRVFGRLG